MSARSTMTRALAAAVAASLLLVAVYAAVGGGGYEPDRPPDPCHNPARADRSGITGAAERVGLNALNGAACDLGVSRERLILVLNGAVDAPPGLTEDRRNDAFRDGLLDALGEEERAGRIGRTEAITLGLLVKVAPVGTILDRLFDGG